MTPSAFSDQHFPTAGHPELLGATHAWRAMLRQAAAYLDALVASTPDRNSRTAMRDVVIHVQQACALLSAIDAAHDPDLALTRRSQYVSALEGRAQHHA